MPLGPGRPARKLEKAPGLRADEIILDLEDSVPADLKAEARGAVAAALAAEGWSSPSISVRVNGPATPWHEDDLRAIAAAPRLASVIVPKVETAEDLGHRRGAARRGSAGIQALIESARGLQRVDQIAAAGGRLEALILGPADMSVSLGFPSPRRAAAGTSSAARSSSPPAPPGCRRSTAPSCRSPTSTACAPRRSGPGSSASTASGRFTPTRSSR